MGPGTFGLVVTIVVMAGIAVFILLFERRRAREIEADPQRRSATHRRSHRDDTEA